MTNTYFGYTPEKMDMVRGFIKDGINKKSIDELIEFYNTLFNKNETSKGCTNCAKNRYRQIIINWLANGEAIWKKHNLYELESSLLEQSNSEDDSFISQEQSTSTAEPETAPTETKTKRTRNGKNKDK